MDNCKLYFKFILKKERLKGDKMICYLIKVNDLYYGRENAKNGRILRVETTEDVDLPYIVQDISYKTKKGAEKAAKKLQKEKKGAKISIQGIMFK